MTCHPFCDLCGGNLGHPANGDWICDKCKAKPEVIADEFPPLGSGICHADGFTHHHHHLKTDALRKGRKKRIRKDEFEPSNPLHFRLQSRGGAWRYYVRVG